LSNEAATGFDDRQLWPAIGGAASAREVRWLLDPRRTSVEFIVSHIWGLKKMRGRFSASGGVLDLRIGFEREVKLTIDARSVYTGDRKRDHRLRSADFLNADACPEMQFVATTVTPRSGIELEISGDLRIAGRTVPVESTVTVVRVDNDLDVVVQAELEAREVGGRTLTRRRIRTTVRARMISVAIRAGRDRDPFAER
jgi:polyisoprenoid-binding protein YceI